MNDTTATPPPGATAPPSGVDRFFAWLRGLDVRRNTDDKWIAGVCSGLARRFNVDPVLIRAAFVVLFCLGGIGFTVYLLVWVFLPETNGTIVAERALRHGDAWSVVLVVVLGLALIGGPSVARDWNAGLWAWWLIVPIAVLVWFLSRRSGPHPPAVGGGSPSSVEAAPYGAVPPASATQTVQSSSTGLAGSAGPVVTDSTGAAAPPSPPAWPTTPPPPSRPRRRSAGLFGALLTIGVAMAGYALGLLLDGPIGFPGSREMLGLVLATAAAGLCVLVFGLSGRKSGFGGFVAVLLALATWAAAIVPGLTVTNGIGDRAWYAPSTTDTSYSLGIGDARLSLSPLSGYRGAQRHYEANVGVGQLTVIVPDGVTVQVHSTIGLGALDTNGDGTFEVKKERFDGSGGRGGPGIDNTTVVGSGTPTVTVDAHVGIGDIVISKGARQ